MTKQPRSESFSFSLEPVIRVTIVVLAMGGKNLQFFEFEFIIFKDSPTGKNPDRGGLHREVVRK